MLGSVLVLAAVLAGVITEDRSDEVVPYRAIREKVLSTARRRVC
jgi:hypothetical protein